jgi:hypothetical protein
MTDELHMRLISEAEMNYSVRSSTRGYFNLAKIYYINTKVTARQKNRISQSLRSLTCAASMPEVQP